MDDSSASKLCRLSGAPAPGRNRSSDLVRRIRDRLEGAVAAGEIGELAALKLRAEIAELVALGRVLRRRPRAPLAGRG